MSRETLTIIAPASALVPSAVHLVRTSGPRAFAFLEAVTGRRGFKARMATLMDLRDGDTLLDRALVLPFPGPASYTGEDVVEYHLHGSPDLTRSFLRVAIQFGLSPAEPGEFTRRAFLAGKLSLEQAEAVNAVIQSRGRHLRQNALRILEGKTSLKFSDARDEILDLLADVETSIEFPEDRPETVFHDRTMLYERLTERLTRLRDFFSTLHRRYRTGRQLDEGIRVVLLGRPNAGKSTLMNALLGEERVLVSPEAGTTRDWVRERCTLGSLTLQIYDTAGLREAPSDLEQRGILGTRAQVREADVLLLLVHELETLTALETLELPPEVAIFPVLTKCDLHPVDLLASMREGLQSAGYAAAPEVNLTSVSDLERLKSAMESFLTARFRTEDGELSLLSERQAVVARDLESRFSRILDLLSQGDGEEVVSEEMRILSRQMGELDLSWGGEDVLDHLFSKFCLGK